MAAVTQRHRLSVSATRSDRQPTEVENVVSSTDEGEEGSPGNVKSSRESTPTTFCEDDDDEDEDYISESMAVDEIVHTTFDASRPRLNTEAEDEAIAPELLGKLNSSLGRPTLPENPKQDSVGVQKPADSDHSIGSLALQERQGRRPRVKTRTATRTSDGEADSNQPKNIQYRKRIEVHIFSSCVLHREGNGGIPTERDGLCGVGSENNNAWSPEKPRNENDTVRGDVLVQAIDRRDVASIPMSALGRGGDSGDSAGEASRPLTPLAVAPERQGDGDLLADSVVDGVGSSRTARLARDVGNKHPQGDVEDDALTGSIDVSCLTTSLEPAVLNKIKGLMELAGWTGKDDWQQHLPFASCRTRLCTDMMKQLSKLGDILSLVPVAPNIGLQNKFLDKRQDLLNRLFYKIDQEIGRIRRSGLIPGHGVQSTAGGLGRREKEDGLTEHKKLTQDLIEDVMPMLTCLLYMAWTKGLENGVDGDAKFTIWIIKLLGRIMGFMRILYVPTVWYFKLHQRTPEPGSRIGLRVYTHPRQAEQYKQRGELEPLLEKLQDLLMRATERIQSLDDQAKAETRAKQGIATDGVKRRKLVQNSTQAVPIRETQLAWRLEQEEVLLSKIQEAWPMLPDLALTVEILDIPETQIKAKARRQLDYLLCHGYPGWTSRDRYERIGKMMRQWEKTVEVR